METLLITAKDLTNGVYTGKTDVTHFDGHIIIEKDLGDVYFPGLVKASGRIEARTCSGIRSAKSISAILGIKASFDIWAYENITSDGDIASGFNIQAGMGISSGREISAMRGVIAGGGLRAANCIWTGESISSGLDIEAEWISAQDRIFAGICVYRMPTPKEMEIRAEIRSGKVAFGTHVPPRLK